MTMYVPFLRDPPHTNILKWQYFVPIQNGMPKNCSKDVTLVVDYMDDVFKKGTASEQLALKQKFGLEYLTHADDVMGYISSKSMYPGIKTDFL